LTETFLAISNHGSMIGGGEHAFLDLLGHLPTSWKPWAIVPKGGELFKRLSTNHVPALIIPLPSIRPWTIVSMITSLRTLLDAGQRAKSSFVYANGSRAAFYAGIAGRILQIPVIWHCRIAEPDRYLDPILTRLSSSIVVNSRATARRFKSKTSKKVKPVYNGVNIEWLKEEDIKRPREIQKGWKAILVIARVSRRKRHDIALIAFEKVATAEPNAHLFFLGRKDPRDKTWWDELQGRTFRSPFSERIHWIGEVEDVRPWLQSAFLLLSASENESFGRVLIEAMACAVPVIAARSGGVPEVVRDGQDGLLVTPGRPDEMAEAILKLLRNKPLRQKLVESGNERAKLFSLDAHVKKMVEVFEETIKR